MPGKATTPVAQSKRGEIWAWASVTARDGGRSPKGGDPLAGLHACTSTPFIAHTPPTPSLLLPPGEGVPPATRARATILAQQQENREPRTEERQSTQLCGQEHSTENLGGYSSQRGPRTGAAPTPHPPFLHPRLCGAPRMLLVAQKISGVISLAHKQQTRPKVLEPRSKVC